MRRESASDRVGRDAAHLLARAAKIGAVLLLLFLSGVAYGAEQKKKQPPAKPIDLNNATAEQLQQLPGIGPTTAKAIVRFREKSGPFRRVEDLLVIRGITRRRLDQLRPHVTVTPRAAKPKS